MSEVVRRSAEKVDKWVDTLTLLSAFTIELKHQPEDLIKPNRK